MYVYHTSQNHIPVSRFSASLWFDIDQFYHILQCYFTGIVFQSKGGNVQGVENMLKEMLNIY